MNAWDCGGCGHCLACAVVRDTPAEHLARTTDPSTSARSAQRAALRSGSQKAALLAAYSNGRAIADQVAAERAGLAHTRSWWKRCSDLRSDGLIAQVGTTEVRGEIVMCCEITPRGVAALDKLRGTDG
jgi:hypothetical protein